MANRELSSPFGGEFLRYLKSSTPTNNKRVLPRFIDPVDPIEAPPGYIIIEVDDFEDLIDTSNSTSIMPAVDLDKSNKIERMSPELTSFKPPEDFNLDLFDDVDPKEIEQYKTHYPNLEKIADSKSHCTSCQYHIGTAPINEAFIKMHPILRVTQCKKCFTFYNSGEFERGEDGSELYCRWCGQGGEVYCCSNCPYVFCRRCIVQNLSRNMVTEIQNNENWNCFACAPQCMIPLRANHWALVNFIEKQKRQIADQSTDEKELNELMSNDISRCCSNNKKRIPLKRKLDNTAVITPASPPEKRKSVAPIPEPKLLNEAPMKTPVENKVAAADDDSVTVQCTPDILSLFNNDEQNASPSATPNNQATGEAPPLRLIRREVTIRPNQAGNRPILPVPQSTPPPKHPTPPIQHPTPPPPSTPIQNNPPLSIHTAPATSNPVYHTINGFRIDLNTAAQQETYRLPNGKLIQVKKQTPIVTQASPMAPERPAPVISRPQIQPVRPPPVPTVRPQITARGSAVGSGRVARPLYQGQQHRQPIQIPTRFVGNNQIRVNGPVIQPMNSSPQQVNPNLPPPLVFRTSHGNTPVGKARTQFEERVDNSMEVCQHIIGKINTLTNSSSYKKVKSLMDLKDLTIHLSYLLTYAIGRFKSLQEKCIEDMKNMGFDPDNTATGSVSDDDDIQIVEQKTTTINLDSDEEDGIPSAATNSANTNQTENVTPAPVSNGGQSVTAPSQTLQNQLVDSSVANNNALTQQENNNANNEAVEVVDLLEEPMEVTVPTADGKSPESHANNDDDIVQVVEITENDDEKNENNAKHEDKSVKVVENESNELNTNDEQMVKENGTANVPEPSDSSPNIVKEVMAVEIETEETGTSQIGDNESDEPKSKKDECMAEDNVHKESSIEVGTILLNILENKAAEPDKDEAKEAETDVNDSNESDSKNDENYTDDNVIVDSTEKIKTILEIAKDKDLEDLNDLTNKNENKDKSKSNLHNNEDSLPKGSSENGVSIVPKNPDVPEENISEPISDLVSDNLINISDDVVENNKDTLLENAHEVSEENIDKTSSDVNQNIDESSERDTSKNVSENDEIAENISENMADTSETDYVTTLVLAKEKQDPLEDIRDPLAVNLDQLDIISNGAEDKEVEDEEELSDESEKDINHKITSSSSEDNSGETNPDLSKEEEDSVEVSGNDTNVKSPSLLSIPDNSGETIPDLSKEEEEDSVEVSGNDTNVKSPLLSIPDNSGETIPDLSKEEEEDSVEVSGNDTNVKSPSLLSIPDNSGETIPDLSKEEESEILELSEKDTNIKSPISFTEENSGEMIPDISEENISDEIPAILGLYDENIDNDVSATINMNVDKSNPEESNESIIPEQLPSTSEKILDTTEKMIEDDEILSVAEIPEGVSDENITDTISDILQYDDKLTDNICLPDDIDDDIIMKTLELDSSV